ncbi:MAG: DoxX family protein [Halobacteriaceae archaeon]
MNDFNDTILLVGRILLAIIFVVSGAYKIANFGGTVDQIAGKGLPLASFGAVLAIVVELGGGLSLALGYRTRSGAWLLFLFLIPTTLIFHNFWAFSGRQFQMQMISFMKNLAIMGGLLVLTTVGSGRYSVISSRER